MREISYVSLLDLAKLGALRNPKKHSLPTLEASLIRFGFVSPVVVDGRTGLIVAGHGRRDAALSLHSKGKAAPDGVFIVGGAWEVPTLAGWSSKNDAEAEAFLLADNQTAALGGWDDGLLSKMLADQGDALAGTGFTAAAIDRLLDRPVVDLRASNVFQVLVDVSSELEQSELIDRLEREKFKCRPLIF